MSYDDHGTDHTFNVAADMSAKQYRFMTIDSSGNAAVSTRGQFSVGILQNKPAAVGRPGTVRTAGVSKAVLGGSVTAGNAVVSDANGAAVTTSSGDTAYMGIALQTGVSGDIVPVFIQPRGLS
jgi:hypothetical protein